MRVLAFPYWARPQFGFDDHDRGRIHIQTHDTESLGSLLPFILYAPSCMDVLELKIPISNPFVSQTRLVLIAP